MPGAGWFGWVSYDAGEFFEPAARATHSKAIADRDWPFAAFQRIESSDAFDSTNAQWRQFGAHLAIPAEALGTDNRGEVHGYTLDRIDAAKNRDQYIAGVHRIIEYIRAGDAYQVNLAHRLSTPFSGSPRGLFADLVEAAQPWHGGYFEADGYALASLSPELFLEADLRTGEVRTRPMKGTRPYTEATDAAARLDLDSSTKDRAELAMIVDLMRNDLGRVCDLGSVRVEQERRIEKHASGVLQSTATVAGRLRRGTTLLDLLRATFPPGSVTGAPKIRAMQIIDELEPVRRGPYCGTMLWIGDDGKLEANVMIRTACVSRDPRSGAGKLDYSVGAGIVVDSDPAGEWLETLVKAALVLETPHRWMHQAAKRSEA
ncbi:MAG: anthranilate synthase component I family protein [Phycisphaerales bacterium]|nr:anthranilate synthase component I family protein [Phycisphaerales bacterium]